MVDIIRSDDDQAEEDGKKDTYETHYNQVLNMSANGGNSSMSRVTVPNDNKTTEQEPIALLSLTQISLLLCFRSSIYNNLLIHARAGCRTRHFCGRQGGERERGRRESVSEAKEVSPRPNKVREYRG